MSCMPREAAEAGLAYQMQNGITNHEHVRGESAPMDAAAGASAGGSPSHGVLTASHAAAPPVTWPQMPFRVSTSSKSAIQFSQPVESSRPSPAVTHAVSGAATQVLIWAISAAVSEVVLAAGSAQMPGGMLPSLFCSSTQPASNVQRAWDGEKGIVPAFALCARCDQSEQVRRECTVWECPCGWGVPGLVQEAWLGNRCADRCSAPSGHMGGIVSSVRMQEPHLSSVLVGHGCAVHDPVANVQLTAHQTHLRLQRQLP